MNVNAWMCAPATGRVLESGLRTQEHKRCDPKDGDLCLRRAKSGETLEDARSDTDVHIVPIRHTTHDT